MEVWGPYLDAIRVPFGVFFWIPFWDMLGPILGSGEPCSASPGSRGRQESQAGMMPRVFKWANRVMDGVQKMLLG